jgi:hypothetical protein
MINKMPTTAKRNKIRNPKAETFPAAHWRQLMHEIYNQLTVMNLCCFKFRGAVAPLNDAQLLSDVERMENTTTELAALVENFSNTQPLVAIAGGCAVPATDALNEIPPPANVYPLFKPIRRRR